MGISRLFSPQPRGGHGSQAVVLRAGVQSIFLTDGKGKGREAGGTKGANIDARGGRRSNDIAVSLYITINTSDYKCVDIIVVSCFIGACFHPTVNVQHDLQR